MLPPSADLSPIDRLRAIMHCLRAPGGCPWDAEQTHESLIPSLIEEAYEVADAIRCGDRDALVDELGDLLLQPIFHAELGSENVGAARFDFDDIARAICEKLVRRHPHVFEHSEAECTLDDSGEVLRQWDEIKRVERGDTGEKKHFLEWKHEGLPSLLSAQKIQNKVAKVGFDWPADDDVPVVEKIREELAEVEAAIAEGDERHVDEEIGDLLFAVVNLARRRGSDAETLLDAANRKFAQRFQQTEDRLREQGRSLKEADLDEMDAAWNAVK
jgi:XTP/dITP diphosphohydrolase/tetrapyrrole methylase family protein/MazG family protein